MVTNVSFNNVQSTTAATQPQKKNLHVVAKNENLWTIARKQLGENAKNNADVQKYVSEIAQLNGLDTHTKRNKLKIGQELNLPELNNAKSQTTTTPQQKQQTPQTEQKSLLLFQPQETKTIKIDPVYDWYKKPQTEKLPEVVTDLKMPEKPLQPTPSWQARNSFTNLRNILLNNTTLEIKPSSLNFAYDSNEKLYHVTYKTKDSNGLAHNKPITQFSINTKTKKINYIYCENYTEKLNNSGWDYKLDKNSNITNIKDKKSCAKLSQENLNDITNKLIELYESTLN